MRHVEKRVGERKMRLDGQIREAREKMGGEEKNEE